MFVANTITAWVEAFQALFSEDYPNEDLRGIKISPEYPLEAVDYPGLWINFSMQGVVKNVGIGHVEYAESETGFRPVYRWQFGGNVEITVGTMSNLERALLLDEVTKAIAIARVDENNEGVLRETIDRNDLIGMNVVWESFTIAGFGEAQGTPWGADDVIYEATINLMIEGEVVLDSGMTELVPLSAVVYDITEEPLG